MATLNKFSIIHNCDAAILKLSIWNGIGEIEVKEFGHVRDAQ